MTPKIGAEMHMSGDPKNQTSALVSCIRDTSGCPLDGLPELIRMRAYELYTARGKQPGHDLDDWLQAEREIKHHKGL